MDTVLAFLVLILVPLLVLFAGPISALIWLRRHRPVHETEGAPRARRPVEWTVRGVCSAAFLPVLLTLSVAWIGFATSSCDVTARYEPPDGFDLIQGTDVALRETVCTGQNTSGSGGCSTDDYIYEIPAQRPIHITLVAVVLGFLTVLVPGRSGYRTRALLGVVGAVAYLAYLISADETLQGTWKGPIPDSHLTAEDGPGFAASLFTLVSLMNIAMPWFLRRCIVLNSAGATVAATVILVLCIVPAMVLGLTILGLYTYIVANAFFLSWPAGLVWVAVPAIPWAFWVWFDRGPVVVGMHTALPPADTPS